MKRTDSHHPKVRYVDFRKGSSSKAPEQHRPRRVKGWMIAAAAGIPIAIGSSVYLAYSQVEPADTSGVFATSEGESWTGRFRDGVEIKLGANSRASFDPKEGEPCLNLEEGQVEVTAAMDPNRTFAVQTQLGRASTFGATYRVSYDSSMLVEVYRGDVVVSVHGMPTVTVKEGNRYRVFPRRAAVAYERGQDASRPLRKSAMTVRAPANRSA